jgi:hypothetical protein
MRRVLVWIVVIVGLLLSVFNGVEQWSRRELAGRECRENPMPDRDLHDCIIERWLYRRRVGENNRQQDR